MALTVFVLYVYLNIACFRMTASKEDFEFKLYTRANQLEPYVYKNLYEKLQEGPTKNMKVIVPGHLHSYNSPWVEKMRDNYLKVEDCNVIILQWVRAHWYEFHFSDATPCLKAIGIELGKFLERLRQKNMVNFKNVHFIGHGLGAHIAGFAGANLSGQIERITGLDPLHYKRFLSGEQSQLQLSDGKFVNIIHTYIDNNDVLSTPIGHADFFPNGGVCTQPGCPDTFDFHSGGCAHDRAYEIMSESILNPKSFIATKCNNWRDYQDGLCKNGTTIIHAGEYTKPENQGISHKYFFHTNKESPLAKESRSSEVYILHVDIPENS